MAKSIFELENRIDIESEFRRMVKVLYEGSTIYHDYMSMSLYKFLNDYVFTIWPYRDTFLTLEEYFSFIGIDDYTLKGVKNISKISFLFFVELMLNMFYILDKTYGLDSVGFRNIRTKNFFMHNIPIVLEKLNYEYYEERDKFRIRKRSADVDSILENVPKNIEHSLLDYLDIRNNNLKTKKEILKSIDIFIDNNKKHYKAINNDLLTSIDTIVNNMGVNHESKKEPFISLTESELIAWYDKCFKMMIHLIREEEIINIKKERKELTNS